MNPTRWDQAYDQAMKIIARVTAGVTHEIKNKLAVLQEQGSLMGDLAEKAALKGPLDHERVGELAKKLVERVHETDAIVRRLNSFVHAADKTFGCLEAREALFLMIEMYRRQAEMKPVYLVAHKNERSINVETRPLFLLAALFTCLEAAAAVAPAGAEIETGVLEDGSEIRFRFDWEGPDPARPDFSTGLLEALGARTGVSDPGPGLYLTLPAMSRCGPPPDLELGGRAV